MIEHQMGLSDTLRPTFVFVFKVHFKPNRVLDDNS